MIIVRNGRAPALILIIAAVLLAIPVGGFALDNQQASAGNAALSNKFAAR